MRGLVSSLSEAEQALVRETAGDHLAILDEDDLVALHTRAANKRVQARRDAS
jgi:hypothetical protein